MLLLISGVLNSYLSQFYIKIKKIKKDHPMYIFHTIHNMCTMLDQKCISYTRLVHVGDTCSNSH